MSTDMNSRSPQGTAPTPPVLLFDFDGTVSLGHGPVLAYADKIAKSTGISTILDTAKDILATQESPITVETPEGTYNPRDGYDLVRTISAQFDVSEAICQEAYLDSRKNLATTGIFAPVGLADFLSEYPGKALLATNSPRTGLDAALKSLGLLGAFDEIHTNVGKPEGLERILESHDIGAEVIAFGDIWEFDLAPVIARGGQTALIQTQFSPSNSARPTWRVENIGSFLSQHLSHI
ncbi:HAD family hydrolase [Corynebacterium sp. MSK072]|uniref:HAD family hydrolase n=1 Tax=Corynebacterium rhinophilum TaxID=3050197 RepID=UPI00254BCB06|nr:hypothetical protein [Corynebacterium sp. MSK072]MDK8829901.1 hypothetical protein [Corynebacterium sp. MSK072]